jgi:DNA-binding response OmpR family regulator
MNGVHGEAMVGMRPRVLLLAQQPSDLASVQSILEARGCIIGRCSYADDLPRQVASFGPHLAVICERTLLDLLDLCRAVREASQAPLLVVGQRDVEEDEVLCLEYGADCYLGPDTSVRLVRAHLAALLRRGLAGDPGEADESLSFGEVRVDMRRHRVLRAGLELDLSHKEYSLLRFLIENAGRPVSRQALADVVWGAGATSDNRSLDVHIHWLREKLETDAGNPRHIRTVRGVGYCFEP